VPWSEDLEGTKSNKMWAEEEDQLLRDLVGQLGTTEWAKIGTKFGGNRNGRQCRERWRNQLDPTINKEPWTREEESTLLQAHEDMGNKWTEISRLLPGRTDNAIKNHWNSANRRLIRQGASDPSLLTSNNDLFVLGVAKSKATEAALLGEGGEAVVKVGKGKKRASESQLDRELASVAEGQTQMPEGQKLTALDISDSEDEGAEDEYYKHTAGGSGSIFSKKGAAAPAPTAAAGPVAAAAAAVAAPAVAASTAAAAAAPAASTPAPAPPTPASSAPAAVPVEGKRRRATPSK